MINDDLERPKGIIIKIIDDEKVFLNYNNNSINNFIVCL